MKPSSMTRTASRSSFDQLLGSSTIFRSVLAMAHLMRFFHNSNLWMAKSARLTSPLTIEPLRWTNESDLKGGSVCTDDTEGVVPEFVESVLVNHNIEYLGVILHEPFRSLFNEVVLNKIEKLIEEKFISEHQHRQ